MRKSESFMEPRQDYEIFDLECDSEREESRKVGVP